MIDLSEDIFNEDMEEDDWDFHHSYLDDEPSQIYNHHDETPTRQRIEESSAYLRRSTNNSTMTDPTMTKREPHEQNICHRNSNCTSPEISFSESSDFECTDNPPESLIHQPTACRANNLRPHSNQLKRDSCTTLPSSCNLKSKEFVTASQVAEMNNVQIPTSSQLDKEPAWPPSKRGVDAQCPSVTCGATRKTKDKKTERETKRAARGKINSDYQSPSLSGQIAENRNILEKGDTKTSVSHFSKR